MGAKMIPHCSGLDQGQLLDCALDYAARGWSIIAIRDKKAAGSWKQFQTARPDASTLRKLFRARGINGLAVLLGQVSGGLVCRDFDCLEIYNSWANRHRQLAADLPTVETARGRHVYFRGPGGYFDFGNGEYRGDSKHYCVLPPSRHPTGAYYRWDVPLPSGDLPTIDPVQFGLLPALTERTETTEWTERNSDNGGRQRKTEDVYASEEWQEIINSTLPKKHGQRTRRLFDLCRQLKGTSLADAPPRILRPIVVDWHQKALPTIRTQEFAETWAHFLSAWGKVRFSAGQGAIDTAFQRAAQSTPPAYATALYNERGILLLVALCRELQRQAGAAPFILDCRTAGRLLGVSHVMAWKWLRVLCADEILDEVEKGSQATGKASRFRYIAEQRD